MGSKLMAAALASLLVVGCGGGGGGGAPLVGGLPDSGDTASPAPTAPGATASGVIQGTASAGQQISGQVYARDATGVVFGPFSITPTGTFSLPAAALRAPIVLKADGYVGGRPVTLYSAASGPGTANVNPVTDLAIRVATGTTAGVPFWELPANHGPALSDASLADAARQVSRLIDPFLAQFGASQTDAFRDPVQLGKGVDAVFDRVALRAANGTVQVTSLVNNQVLATAPFGQLRAAAPVNVSAQLSLQAARPTILGWYGPSGMRFGAGFDSVSTSIAGNCVTYSAIDPAIGSIETTYAIQVVEDASQIAEHLEVSATAHVKVGLYKGSARTDIAQDMARDTTSVYIVASAEVLGQSFNLANAQLKPEWQAKLATDAAGFRESCGDEFLSTITTGGKFLGFLKIATSSTEQKRAIAAEVKGKYSGLFNKYSGEASLKSNLDTLTKQYKGAFSVFQFGPATNSLPTNYDDFIRAMQDFPRLVNDRTCLGNYANCPYKVTFSDYATIAPGTLDSSSERATMAALINYSVQYDQLLATIADVEARPGSYQTPTFSLSTLEAQIEDSRRKVADKLAGCVNDSADCNAVPADVLDPVTASNSLPRSVGVVAQSCADYKQNYPALAADGEYVMYLGRDLKKPFVLYCYKMSSEPQDFLSLPYNSPASFNPSYNYTSSVTDDGSSFTVFRKVRVQVSGSDLVIVRDDYTFADTVTSGVSSAPSRVPLGPLAFGETQTFGTYNDTREWLQGKANVNLTGTAFALAAGVAWHITDRASGTSEYSNWVNHCDSGHPNCGAGAIVMSTDRKSVSLHIAGKPGWNIPVGDVRLQWVGQSSP